MSSRYIQQMPIFSRRNVESLEALLDTVAIGLTPQQLKEIKSDNDRRAKDVGVSSSLLNEVTANVEAYARASNSLDVGPDLQAQMVRILVGRIGVRQQRGLFDEQEEDAQGKVPKANSSVAHGGRVRFPS